MKKAILLTVSLSSCVLYAQIQVGPNSPGTLSNTSCSFAYGSTLHLAPPGNAAASNNQYATASHCNCCDANTSCLQATNFGFSIPGNATINGIIVQIEKRATFGSNIQDNGLRLLKNGVEVGANKASTTPWPGQDAYFTYGACNDLWNTTWTPADINQSNFGLVFAAIDYSCSGTPSSFVDHIRITICYTACQVNVTSAYSVQNNILTCTFTDQSSNALSWFWDFGDGNTSIAQNPVHTYADSGTYNVCLIASDNCGSDTSCQKVTVCHLTQPGFSSVANLLNVVFTDTSKYADSWLWSFGDGNTSMVQHPTHTYAQNGTYNVCLTTNNTCYSDSTCRSITVNDNTGVSKLKAQENTSVYPNPASQELFVQMAGKHSGTRVISLYNVLGEKVLTYSISGTKPVRIPVAHLSDGMYLYRISENEKLIHAGKIAIEK